MLGNNSSNQNNHTLHTSLMTALRATMFLSRVYSFSMSFACTSMPVISTCEGVVVIIFIQPYKHIAQVDDWRFTCSMIYVFSCSNMGASSFFGAPRPSFLPNSGYMFSKLALTSGSTLVCLEALALGAGAGAGAFSGLGSDLGVFLPLTYLATISGVTDLRLLKSWLKAHECALRYSLLLRSISPCVSSQ